MALFTATPHLGAKGIPFAGPRDDIETALKAIAAAYVLEADGPRTAELVDAARPSARLCDETVPVH